MVFGFESFLNFGHLIQVVRSFSKFDDYKVMALGKGFLLVSASPLTRSSYHAGDDFRRLRAAREAKLAAAG